MKRRKFIQSTALCTSSMLLWNCKMEKLKRLGDFGIQLWSVRHDMDADPIATLKILSEIGFTDIECTGYNEGAYYNMSLDQFKSVLQDVGLTMKSVHVKTGKLFPDQTRTMSNNWEGFCEDNVKMGAKSVVCGYFEEGERQTIDDYKWIADLFNKCGEVAKSYGLTFAHHNHDFEFHPIDGKVPYDILLEETDPEVVKFEMDHYWVKKGNSDAFKYFEKYPGRFPVWHIKDMDDTPAKFFTEVGSGIIDWTEVFKAGELAGLEYFYVEQDEFKSLKPLESVKQSHNYLKNLEY